MVQSATKTSTILSPFRDGATAPNPSFCGSSSLFILPVEIHNRFTLSESPLRFSFASLRLWRKESKEDFLWIKIFTSQSSFRSEAKLGSEGFCGSSTHTYGENFFEMRDYWGTDYKFNGKEKDEETGMYYYGARYYTPELSIWLSVDPMSDKYPSMSPFMYCAGNPVVLIDPNGMDIEITGTDGSKTTYKPNMKYEGNEFTKQAVETYNSSYNSSETARADIDNLVNAKGVYQVIKSNGKSNFYGYEDSDGNKAGRIRWNPEGNAVPVQKDKNSLLSNPEANPIAELIHETIHGSRFESGINISRSVVKRGTPLEEIETVHRENMFRSDMGYSLRTHYGLDKSTGKPVGTGYPMLIFRGGKVISNYMWQTKRQSYEY